MLRLDLVFLSRDLIYYLCYGAHAHFVVFDCVISVVLLQLTSGCHFFALIWTYLFTQLDDPSRVAAGNLLKEMYKLVR